MDFLGFFLTKFNWIWIKLLNNYYHKKNLPDDIINSFEFLTNGLIHYSQEGEDILIYRDINLNNGFFIDIGAHHPTRFSNTYALYRRGWRGINIDVNPGSMKKFDLLRPEDTNLELAVSNTSQSIDYYRFSDPAYNTVDKKIAENYVNSGIDLVEVLKISPKKLKEILF